MRALSVDDVWDLAGYERLRDDFRRAIIALKKKRRVAVGPRVTLVFENRATLLFQVQEMLRVERIQDPRAIAREIDVYNELGPGEGELSATLFVEITDLEEIRPELDRMIGIDEHVALVVGDATVQAGFDPKQMEEDRISAVQYVRFPLGPELRAALTDPAVPVRVRIDHPAYQAEAELAPETRASLLDDLAGRDEASLPPPESIAHHAEEIFRHDRVRAYRPASPIAPGHVIVEPVAGPVAWWDADAALLSDCMAAVQQVARLLAGDTGRCRIESGAGPDVALRFHVFPG